MSLEKELQKKVINFCVKNDILAVKVDSTSARGWPDLTVILPNGVVLFIELKTPAGVVSKLQQHMHRKIQKQKGNVYVIRSLKDFQTLISQFT